MPDIQELILTMVAPLVEHQDDITIDIKETKEFYEYHLAVHPDDVGRVIGKQGRVARAIRTIVYSVRTKKSKRVRLVIEGAE
ncbi:RNA-binding protein [Jeotgalibaca sp. PTS2502]|uniref:RNA-binding protein KhpA n=1 Tax=Jeotgalibaca arthritidis TaxID=1868794 RepID=A0A6G7KBV6_9LACT|nr:MULTISPECIES: KH domain-containing protein [Jeotgalibaca]APZ48945.1 RNA-binding protein [Jeotgalibaca sp. PTS2502]QII82736.1 KH domain-containing protein [Jeotgalibaca arthritidis]